jgi:archaellum biogenesis ATPase FlaH
MVTLDIKCFDKSRIPGNATIIVSGKRGSGKSTLVKDLMYNFKYINYGMIMTRTDEITSFYSEFIPDVCVYNFYDKDKLGEYIEHQKNSVITAKENGQGDLDSNGVPNGRTRANTGVIILDDMQDVSKAWKNDECIKTLFLNGRHYNILTILSLQYIKSGAIPEVRSQVDFLFVFHQTSNENKKKLYQEYGGLCENFKLFCDILDKCTYDYQCLVINTSGKTIEEQFFFYKAKNNGHFRAFNRKIWDYQDRRLNSNYKSNKKETDAFSNAKNVKVTISKSGDILGYKAS